MKIIKRHSSAKTTDKDEIIEGGVSYAGIASMAVKQASFDRKNSAVISMYVGGEDRGNHVHVVLSEKDLLDMLYNIRKQHYSVAAK